MSYRLLPFLFSLAILNIRLSRLPTYELRRSERDATNGRGSCVSSFR